VVQPGQDVPREQVTLGDVRVAGQDEGIHAELLVLPQFGQHLVRVAHDGGPGTGTGPPDPRP
jgi:hypothetical protein